MAEDKFLLISMDDERTKSLADVLGNKTCKKIIEFLSETNQASQKDLADELKAPINTIDYNIKKLLKSGFVQKRKNFFWSKKGKKIVMYELTNKSIIISPKTSVGKKIKSILPSFILLFAGTIAIWVYEKIKSAENEAVDYIIKSSALSETLNSDSGIPFTNINPDPIWLWFLSGGLLVLFIFSVINWRKL